MTTDDTAADKPGYTALLDSFVLGGMSKLSHRAVVALLVIVQHADDRRQAYPSYDRIGRLIGSGWRTAKRAVEELIDAGVLIRTNRPGESSIYVVAEHVTPRGAKSGRGPAITPAKSDRGTPAKSDNPPLPNLTQEPYPKNQTQLNHKKKPAGAGEPPAKLLELIDGWNALPAGIVKPGNGANRKPPSKAALKGWAKAQGEPEQREAFADIPALLEALKRAKACHGQDWFTVPWLFGTNKNREFNVAKVLNGQHDTPWSKANGNGKPVRQDSPARIR